MTLTALTDSRSVSTSCRSFSTISRPSRSIRATVWLTVGPLWCSRSAMRARSAGTPSSSSSRTVRRYISVVSTRSFTAGFLPLEMVPGYSDIVCLAIAHGVPIVAVVLTGRRDADRRTDAGRRAGPNRPAGCDRCPVQVGRATDQATTIWPATCPGAVFADLEADFSGPPGAAGRHLLPDPATSQAALRRAGVRSDRGAGRVRRRGRGRGGPGLVDPALGRPSRRRTVLDGGLAAWLARRPPGRARRRRLGDFEVRPAPCRGSLPSATADEAADLGPVPASCSTPGPGQRVLRRTRARRPGGRPHPRRAVNRPAGRAEPRPAAGCWPADRLTGRAFANLGVRATGETGRRSTAAPGSTPRPDGAGPASRRASRSQRLTSAHGVIGVDRPGNCPVATGD